MSCAIASLHAARDMERGGDCECEHCSNDCDCHDASYAIGLEPRLTEESDLVESPPWQDQ